MLLNLVILTCERTDLCVKCIFILTGILPHVILRAENITCSSGCSPGPDNTTEPCKITSGECLYGCEDGFYGSNCTQSCSDKDTVCLRCIEKNDSSGIVCNECNRNFYRDSGRCLECNFWCEYLSVNPLPVCRDSDGYCNYGCHPGRYGFRCGLRCRSTCKDTCNRESGHCDVEECKYTSYCGPTCELECHDGCISQHCNKTCDCVDGCNPKYLGKQCKTLCNVNCIQPAYSYSRTCDRNDGTCLYGCKDNAYWGNECKDPCSEGCVNETCQQEAGNCIDGCKGKTVYGLRCDTTCNENCVEGTCESANGYCDKGCATGRYGNQCDLKCNKNCINSTCGRVNGSCDNGCIRGFYGEQCDTACSDKCLGLNCERVGGNCTDGCIAGYQGFKCKSVIPRNCLTDTNGRKTEGSDNKQTFIVGLIVGVTVGVLGTLVVVSIVYVTILRKTTDRGTAQLAKSTTETTYVNQGFNPDSIANQDDTIRINDTDTGRGDEDSSDTQYTTLDHSTKDDYTAYEVIQRA